MKDTYKNILKTGIFTLEFTKKDGTNRKIPATLSREFIPETPEELNEDGTIKVKRIVVSNPDAMKFYDTEANCWKSCLVENIIGVY